MIRTRRPTQSYYVMCKLLKFALLNSFRICVLSNVIIIRVSFCVRCILYILYIIYLYYVIVIAQSICNMVHTCTRPRGAKRPRASACMHHIAYIDWAIAIISPPSALCSTPTDAHDRSFVARFLSARMLHSLVTEILAKMTSIESCCCYCDNDFGECSCPNIKACSKRQHECLPKSLFDRTGKK